MLTEYRADTYIYNDVVQVTTGAVTWDDCAMKVRTTVVSRPDRRPRHPRRRLHGAHPRPVLR
jgi:D-serine deaminase-like pyridoxal phosphate-dependent protein